MVDNLSRSNMKCYWMKLKYLFCCLFFDAWTRFLSAVMSKYRVSLDLKLVISMKIMTINILIINDWVIIHSINQPPQTSLILFLRKLSAKKLMYVTSPIFSHFGQVFQNFWKSRSFSYMCFSPWYSHYLSLIACKLSEYLIRFCFALFVINFEKMVRKLTNLVLTSL